MFWRSSEIVSYVKFRNKQAFEFLTEFEQKLTNIELRVSKTEGFVSSI